MWFRVNGPTGLGSALREARREGGMTQDDLARRLDVTRTTVIDMEKGGPAAVRRFVDAFSTLGYDVVVVRRGSSIEVREASTPAGASL